MLVGPTMGLRPESLLVRALWPSGAGCIFRLAPLESSLVASGVGLALLESSSRALRPMLLGLGHSGASNPFGLGPNQREALRP
jgi:hypothetical protein